MGARRAKARGSRPARVQDVHDVATSLPHVTDGGSPDRAVYQVGGKSFVFFRSARPDAFDAETGTRYDDVVVFWVPDDETKQALVADPGTPFFTTPHFDGHPSVLLRGRRIGELTRDEVAELVQDAWLSRASARRGRDFLASLGELEDHPVFVVPGRD